MGPVLQALLATTFTYLLTAVGASLVFCVDTLGNDHQTSVVMGVAAGMMLAAVNELLTSMAEESAPMGMWSWLPLAVGFAVACAMMRGMDWCLQQSVAPVSGPTAALQGHRPARSRSGSHSGHMELTVSAHTSHVFMKGVLECASFACVRPDFRTGSTRCRPRLAWPETSSTPGKWPRGPSFGHPCRVRVPHSLQLAKSTHRA